MSLKRTFESTIHRLTEESSRPGKIGYKDTDGTYIVDAPGGDGYVHITTGGPGEYGKVISIAENYQGGPPNLPVRMKERWGSARIIEADSTRLATFNSGRNPMAYAVPRHTHAVGSGMVDPVEGLRFLPGMVHPFKEDGAFGLKVYLEPFFYKYSGEIKYFAGQAFDLTSYRPGTANKKAWVVVGVDPTDNTPTASTGTEYALAITMTQSKIDSTSFPGLIPLGATVLTNGQTAINNMALFADVRPYVSNAVETDTLTLAASGGWPSTTNGCAAAAQTEHATNDVDLVTLDFDAASDEFAQFTTWMPDDWNGGTVTAKVAWTAASSSGDVIWGVQGRAYADDDAIDQAWGTAQTVTDTLTAVGDMCITDATSAITLAGSPAGGQIVQWRVYRDADAGGDTLAADARLVAVKITYTRG
jgi:hypothetical protein